MGLRPAKVNEKRTGVIPSEAKDLLFSCTLTSIRGRPQTRAQAPGGDDCPVPQT
jgi:hypothetical protein